MLTLTLTYGPVFTKVDIPGVLADSLLSYLRVRNPNFDAREHDPDEVPPYFEFFDKEESIVLTGLVPAVLVWAKKSKLEVKLPGWPYHPVDGWLTDHPAVKDDILPGITLKDYQVEAIEKSLKAGRGILEMATGSGKSEVAIALCKVMGTPRTLYMVPDCAAMAQMYDRFLLRGFTELEVGRLGDTVYELGRPVTVAIINSLYSGIKSRDEQVLELLENAELFFSDETHHQAAPSWRVVTAQCKARYRFGLSGTPYKDDKSRFTPTYIHPFDSWLTGLIGPTVVYVPASDLQRTGDLAQCEYVTFPAGGDPVVTAPIRNKWMARQAWHKVYRQGVQENETRNQRIVLLAANLTDAGRVPIISVKWLEHGRDLQRQLWNVQGVPAACSYGNDVLYLPRDVAETEKLKTEDIEITEPKSRKKKSKKKQEPEVETDFVKVVDDVDIKDLLQRGVVKVLIGSTIYDEAQDIPLLTDLINASGGKMPQRFRQKVGRILRLSAGKVLARVWDPFDMCHDFLSSHSQERAKVAAAQGFPVRTDWESFLPWYTFRFATLSVGVKKMRNKELEIACDLTLPISGKNGENSFKFIKPRVAVRVELEDGDNLEECAKTLSSCVKALFVQEVGEQLTTMREVLTPKSPQQATTDYLAKLAQTGK